MNKYIKRTRIVFILLILVTLVLTLYGIFFPMKKEIEINLLDNFNLLAETKANAFMVSVEKKVQGAKGLSSRTVIRNKIIEYLEGKVSFDELKDFTEDKYLDGIRAIEHVDYALRIVDHQIVAGFNDNHEIKANIMNVESMDQLSYAISLDDSLTYLEVISPIIENKSVIGHDLLGFHIDDTILALNRDDVQVLIAENRSNRVYLKTHKNIFEDKMNIYFAMPINYEHEVIIYQSKDSLYARRDSLTRQSIYFIVAGYMFIFLIVYFFIVDYSKKTIRDIAVDRDTYKNQADKDTLTEANTRLFFNEFIQKHPFESGLLILIDLDNFKMINDLYGHAIGDEVLKTIVAVFKNTIRSDDLIIRYGGDEFILFLRKNEHDSGIETIKRIKKELLLQQHFEFPIEFSYGISFVDDMSHINKKIKEADEMMYFFKKKKASQKKEKN